MDIMPYVGADPVNRNAAHILAIYARECPAQHSVADTCTCRPSPGELVSCTYSHRNRDCVPGIFSCLLYPCAVLNIEGRGSESVESADRSGVSVAGEIPAQDNGSLPGFTPLLRFLPVKISLIVLFLSIFIANDFFRAGPILVLQSLSGFVLFSVIRHISIRFIRLRFILYGRILTCLFGLNFRLTGHCASRLCRSRPLSFISLCPHRLGSLRQPSCFRLV